MEQIQKIVALNYPTLSQDVVYRIGAILWEYSGEDQKYAYKNGILIPERLANSKPSL